MTKRIHIFGASGSGTTTLGRHLANSIGGLHLDTDFYYWHKSEPPFTVKRDPHDRIEMIERDVVAQENWVLSGSLCSWGDPLLHQFTHAVFVQLDPGVRIERLLLREKARNGSRISEGGDMRQLHLEFIAWARSYDTARAPIRSLDLHEKWMRQLTCPIIRVDSLAPVEELCDRVLQDL